MHSALPDGASPKGNCALKCTAEAIGVYWACAAVCVKKQAPNSCILDGCPAAVAAFDVPCLKKCPKNATAYPYQTEAPCHYLTTMGDKPDNACAESRSTQECKKWADEVVVYSGMCPSAGFTQCCTAPNVGGDGVWVKPGRNCSSYPGKTTPCK